MRKISYWAKYNPRTARLIIAISELLLFILAFKLGLLLLQSGVHLSYFVIILSVLFFAVAHIIYSKIKWKNSKMKYWYQRLCYFLIGLSVFLLTCFIVSNDKVLSWNIYSPLSGTSLSLPSVPKDSSTTKSLSRKEMRKQLRGLRKETRKNDGLKALYFVLIIVGGVGLLYLTAGLACTLSCNGNEAAAWLIGLLGGGGTIFLCIWLMKKLVNKKTTKNTQPTSFVRN